MGALLSSCRRGPGQEQQGVDNDTQKKQTEDGPETTTPVIEGDDDIPKNIVQNDEDDNDDTSQQNAVNEDMKEEKKDPPEPQPQQPETPLQQPSTTTTRTIRDTEWFQEAQHAWFDQGELAEAQQRNEQANQEMLEESKVEQAQRLWKKLQGVELEPMLQSGAIRLLDAFWLLQHVYQKHQDSSNNAPFLLPCRQELEESHPQAFLTLEQIQNATRERERFPVVCLSYMWLHPDHPDPQGTTLFYLAQTIEREFFDETSYTKRIGIFWDYASLYQHQPHRGIERLPEHQVMFKKGLQGLGSFYSHPHISVLRLTEFPPGYPSEYQVPSLANTAAYENRGWPVMETHLASLTGDSELLKDVETKKRTNFMQPRANGSHPPPMSPKAMADKLQTVSFTNTKDDRPLCTQLYADEFIRRMALQTQLQFHNLGWQDKQVQELGKVLGLGYVPHLTKLSLKGHRFTSQGCMILAGGLAFTRIRPPDHDWRNDSSRMPVKPIPLMHQFTFFELDDCPYVQDEGIRIMAEVLVQIRHVRLKDVRFGVEGCEALVDAAEKAIAGSEDGKTLRLQSLHLSDSDTLNDEAVSPLIDLIVEHFVSIEFGRCNLTDATCQALGNAAAQMHQETGQSCRLQRIEGLEQNRDITSASVPSLVTLFSHCPNLRSVFLPEWMEKEPTIHAQIAAAVVPDQTIVRYTRSATDIIADETNCRQS